MPDNLYTLNNAFLERIILSEDTFPDDLKSLNNWGFCITGWTTDKNGNDKLDKIPFYSYVENGKLVAHKCAPADYLKTFKELGDFPDLNEVAESLGIERPNAIYYRFSLGGLVNRTGETIPAPEIVIFDYDHVIDDTGNFKDGYIKEEIQKLCQAGYVELSASGHGFHAICRKPVDWTLTSSLKADSKPEIFSSDKFVCLTGKVVRDVR